MSPITVWKHSYRPFILVILNFPWFLFSCTTKLSTGLYYLGRMEWGLWRRLVFPVTGILFYLCCLITLSFQKMYIFLGIKENNSWNSLDFCDIMYLKSIPLSVFWRLFFSLPLSPFSLSILCIFPGWSHSCLWLQLPSTWSLISSVCTSNKNIKLPVKNAHLTIPWEPRFNMSKAELLNLYPKSIPPPVFPISMNLPYPVNYGRCLILFLSPPTFRRPSPI